MTTIQRDPLKNHGFGGVGKDEIFLESTRTALVLWRDGALSIQAGSRIGAGVRRIAPSGESSFRSLDDGTGRLARDAWSARDEEAWDCDRVAVAASVWIETAFRAASAALPGSLRNRLSWSASARMYRQSIRVGPVSRDGRAETSEEVQALPRDVRSGARIELAATLEGGRAIKRQVAAADVHGLASERPPSAVGASLAESAASVLEAKSPLRASVAALFEPGRCGALLHELGHCLERRGGRGVGSDVPPLLGTIGWRIAAPTVTIVDDPRASEGRGSYAIDDVGSQASHLVLVREGTLAGEIVSGAGHERRGSYRDAPLPRMACTYLAPGRDDSAELLRTTRRGIYVRALAGGRANPWTGSIDLVLEEGFLIEEGKLARPLAPCLLRGTAAGLLEAIDGVGIDLVFDGGAGDCVRDAQSVPVIVGMPTVRLASIGVQPL